MLVRLLASLVLVTVGMTAGLVVAERRSAGLVPSVSPEADVSPGAVAAVSA
jgi:hypothetical protein